MSKMIQLRNVPDALHRSLKARAALAGNVAVGLPAHGNQGDRRAPTLAELRERLHTRKAVTLPLDTARLVREDREAT